MDILNKIREKKYSELLTDNGAIQFQDVGSIYKGKLIFMSKYLHTVFPALKHEDYLAFINELGININESLKTFLTEHNGLDLFSGSIAVYGFGRVRVNGVYLTSRNPYKPLPFHMYDENNGKINSRMLKIGSVCEKPLYIDNETGVITLGEKDKLMAWKCLNDCLDDLYCKVGEYYDDNGLCKNPVIIKNYCFNKLKEIM